MSTFQSSSQDPHQRFDAQTEVLLPPTLSLRCSELFSAPRHVISEQHLVVWTACPGRIGKDKYECKAIHIKFVRIGIVSSYV